MENCAYGITICAELNAMGTAITNGYQKIIAAAAVTNCTDSVKWPCGSCRQVFREFSNPQQFQLIMVNGKDEMETATLSEMLPKAFGPEFLDDGAINK